MIQRPEGSDERGQLGEVLAGREVGEEAVGVGGERVVDVCLYQRHQVEHRVGEVEQLVRQLPFQQEYVQQRLRENTTPVNNISTRILNQVSIPPLIDVCSLLGAYYLEFVQNFR